MNTRRLRDLEVSANAPYIVLIPGMRSSARIEEIPGAADIELTDN